MAGACLVWFNEGLSEGTDTACPLFSWSPLFGPGELTFMELPKRAPSKEAEPGA